MRGIDTDVRHMHLRPITEDSYQECVALAVAADQSDLVATNMKSLAQAAVNQKLVPLGIYDACHRGNGDPSGAMRGFLMYEVSAGVGFILRLMIDEGFQRRGYGGAAMSACIRRLRLIPAVELIATSHREKNHAAAQLYAGLGFVPWKEEWMKGGPTGEVYLMLQ